MSLYTMIYADCIVLKKVEIADVLSLVKDKDLTFTSTLLLLESYIIFKEKLYDI